MKRLEWITGNHARIETGHKTFDKFCTCLSTGNHIGDGHTSSFIRPWNEKECNGKKDYEPGHLQNFDLKLWRKYGLPRHVDEYVVAHAKTEMVVLNKFWHVARGKGTTHGYIVTRGYDHCYLFMAMFCTNNTPKSWNVLHWCKDYISNLAEEWVAAKESTVRHEWNEHPMPLFAGTEGWVPNLRKAVIFSKKEKMPFDEGIWLSMDDAEYHVRGWNSWKAEQDLVTKHQESVTQCVEERA